MGVRNMGLVYEHECCPQCPQNTVKGVIVHNKIGGSDDQSGMRTSGFFYFSNSRIVVHPTVETEEERELLELSTFCRIVKAKEESGTTNTDILPLLREDSTPAYNPD